MNKQLKTTYASQYRKNLDNIERKLKNLRKSIDNAHVEAAKGWLREISNAANALRRDMELEV